MSLDGKQPTINEQFYSQLVLHVFDRMTFDIPKRKKTNPRFDWSSQFRYFCLIVNPPKCKKNRCVVEDVCFILQISITYQIVYLFTFNLFSESDCIIGILHCDNNIIYMSISCQYTVQPVYKGHSRDQGNLKMLPLWALYLQVNIISTIH